MMTDEQRGPDLGAFPYIALPDRHRDIILRVEAGSTIHGIDVPDSGDDRDELAVAVEPPRYVTGLAGRDGKASYMYRTAANGQRSRPGDLDLTVHGLRKFAALAAGGNPTILQTFFVPDDRRITTPLGDTLLDNVSLFVSRACADAFAGYLRQQRARLEGDGKYRRGRQEGGRSSVARRRKYAAHMLRLGYQGDELLATGVLQLPMRDGPRRACRHVRDGTLPVEWAIETATRLERAIRSRRPGSPVGSPLSERPDREGIDRLLHHIYTTRWEQTT